MPIKIDVTELDCPPKGALSVSHGYDELFVYFMAGPEERVDEIVYLASAGEVTLSAPPGLHAGARYFRVDVQGALAAGPSYNAAEDIADHLWPYLFSKGGPGAPVPARKAPPRHGPGPVGGGGSGGGPGPIKSHPAGS